jgi:lipopolysaccharide/colanic/teichoic acid biosynthesis glycosyltransferase
VKRVLDLLGASIGLVLAALPMALIGLSIWILMGRPILFRQQRPGLHGRPFEIVKFRTMGDEVDGDGRPLTPEERLSWFGRWLRASSLDELPELWNVLVGDMSLVGPRPLMMRYLPLYTPEQARRHEVRPGITGWAQINGRNALSWEDKFRLDVWYVEHRSLMLDLRILGRTLTQVCAREGISEEGQAVPTPFRGNLPMDPSEGERRPLSAVAGGVSCNRRAKSRRDQ